MPKTVKGKKVYSDAEKVAYYKKLAVKGAKKGYANYKKPYRYPGAGRAAGGIIGTALGGLAGNPAAGGMIGSAVGHGAHALMKTVTGYGDYTVSKNSLVYNRDAVPEFSGNARCTIVSHREFVGDVVGSTNFNINTYTINPANSALFPWLSGIAENYEEYVLQGLLFEFKTTCGNSVGSTNTALGTVVMATQYNSLAQPFINKQQMENYEFCQSIVPSDSALHAVECDPKLTANQGLFYVQNSNASSLNADPRMYNIGKFSIATIGMQAANTVGELWVTYKICLLKPRLGANIAGADHYNIDFDNAAPGNPFGNTSSLSTSSFSYSVANTTQALTALKVSPWSQAPLSNPTAIYINPNYVGDLLFVYQAHGGPAINAAPALAAFGNTIIKSLPATSAGFATYSMTQAVGSGGDMVLIFVIQCNGGVSGSTYPYVTLSGGSWASDFTAFNLAVYSIPNNLIN